MALSAQLSMDESRQPTGGRVYLSLALKNTGAAAENISHVSIFPTSQSSPVLVSQPAFKPADTVQVLASGTVTIGAQATVYAPPQLTDAALKSVRIGLQAVVTMADGTQVASNVVEAAVAPQTDPPTKMPTRGQWDFSSNNNSGLWFRP